MRARSLLASAALALMLQGCAHAPPPGGAGGAGAARLDAAAQCELVRTLLREPVPSQLVSQFHEAGYTGEPAPVVVYVRRPAESTLERFFEGTPECGDATFRVMRESAADALVLYLEASEEQGYAYDARRSGPEELTLAGTPQGKVRRSEAGWVTATP